MTEYTKNWILYDGECRVCVGLKKRLARIFEKRGFSWEPLQAEWVGEATGLTEAELMTEMKVLTDQGEVIGGIDAWIYLARRVWWLLPLYALGNLGWGHRLLDWLYRAFAAKRYCVGGTCRIGGG